MKLTEWVANEVEKSKQTKKPKNKTAILKELSGKSSVSLLTLQGVERGATMRLYDKALAVSKATKRQVSVEELCEN